MDKNGKLLTRLTAAVDLPEEPIPGIPLVELLGDRRVLIENHAGIKEYSCERIRVQVSYGQICIIGKDLVLSKMVKGQLVVSGSILEIHLLRGCK